MFGWDGKSSAVILNNDGIYIYALDVLRHREIHNSQVCSSCFDHIHFTFKDLVECDIQHWLAIDGVLQERKYEGCLLLTEGISSSLNPKGLCRVCGKRYVQATCPVSGECILSKPLRPAKFSQIHRKFTSSQLLLIFLIIFDIVFQKLFFTIWYAWVFMNQLPSIFSYYL